MGAMMEKNMAAFASASGRDHAEVLREAADMAVGHIVHEIEELGGTPEQGEAVRDAVRLGLLDDFEGASRRLLDIGFDQEFVIDFLTQLRAEKAATD